MTRRVAPTSRAIAPIEEGPHGDGDRHVLVLVLQQGSCTLFEMFSSYPKGATWDAGSGAGWHLDKNEVRKDEWTSADARVFTG